MLPHRAWVALATVAALAGLAAGVGGEGPEVHPLTAAGDDGEVPAGVPTTLGWVLTNGDGQPAFHEDARFEVRFEGETLLATTPASGHDYDGVDPYQVTFPEPGNYTVHATVFDNSAGETEARELTYNGTVTPAPQQALSVDLEAPDELRRGQAAQLAVEVTGPDGEPGEHADVTVRVRRALDNFEVLKTRTHDHDGEHALLHAFGRAGTFEVTATAAPVPGEPGPSLAPAAASATVNVSQASTETPAPAQPVAQPLVNDRETGEEGPYQLVGTYDPYTSVGPHGRLRLGLLTLDADTRAPARAVDYEATLVGPDGQQLFHSASLHAVDGFEYVTVSRPDPGEYHLHASAAKGDWSDQVTLDFTVLPPAGATNAGPLHATPNASTEWIAGEPVEIPVWARDAAGIPLTHGEVGWRLVHADTGVAAFSGKLHAHENGTLPVTLAAPEGGEYRLELMPQSLQPAPTPFTFGEEVGQPPVFDVAADPAPDPGEPLEEQGEAPDADETPAPGLLGALLAGLAAWTLRRRR